LLFATFLPAGCTGVHNEKEYPTTETVLHGLHSTMLDCIQQEDNLYYSSPNIAIYW